MSFNLPEYVNSWAEWESAISALVDRTFSTNPSFLFRGDCKDHGSLLPSIARHSKGFGIEERLLERFKQQAHLLANGHPLPEDHQRFEWWALMQHYDTPTRLLDWSVSPYVAAYFACRDRSAVADTTKPSSPGNGVVTVAFAQRVGRREARHLDDVSTYSPDAPCDIFFREPAIASQRSSLQRGWFSVITGIGTGCHYDALRRVTPQIDDGFDGSTGHKIEICGKAKLEFLRQLHFRGITAQALFPGLEGLGRRLREEWMIDCHERSSIALGSP